MLESLKQKLSRVNKPIAILLIIVFVLFGVYFLTSNNNKVNNDNNVNIYETKQEDKKETINTNSKGINLQEELLALNLDYPDAKAWLKVDGTSIDTAVFQAKDNERYLRKDRDNVNTNWGEEFLDYRCNINNMSDKSHFIIYGHNTEKDTCFTPLLKYKDKKFFDDHKTIQFSTLKGNYTWEIFSVYITDADFFYIKTVFKDLNEYGNFLNSVKEKSMYDTKISVNNTDTILTLSTCDYSKKDGRFVVQAKLVK